MLDYLERIFHFGSLLGVTIAVFGSPSNRRIPENMSTIESDDIATSFFYSLAERARKYAIYLCIEPNPEFYGTNFITDSFQAIDLVKKVNHPNFKFHLDSGALFINSENPDEVLKAGSAYGKHCHVSEKALAVIAKENPQVSNEQHIAVKKALIKYHYSGWLSIEMRAANNPRESNIQNVTDALEYVQQIYGE